MSRRLPPKTRLLRTGDTIACPRCGRVIVAPDPTVIKHLAWREEHRAASDGEPDTTHVAVLRKAKQARASDVGRNQGEWVWWLDSDV